MPRKPIAVSHPKSSLDRSRVGVIECLDATQLITIDSDHPWWSGKEIYIRVEGAIVRVRPPRDATPDQVAKVRAELIAGKALAVRVLPVRRSEVVPQAARAARARQAPREVAKELVAASSFPDKDALTERVEQRLTQVGL